MARMNLLAVAIVANAGGATAEVNLSINLAIDGKGSLTSQSYACDGGATFPVTYINSGANSLAIVPVDGEERIFVAVMSASGARYASGPLVWWTKGDTATLESEMDAGRAKTCNVEDGASRD